MTQTSFGFQWTTLSLAVSVLALVIVCVLSWFTWRRSGFRRAVLALELLRIMLVGFAIFLLNQPEAVEQYRPSERPTVAILGDQSRSMSTQDVGLGESQSTPLMTRLRASEPILDPTTWQELEDRMDVVISPFNGGDDDGKSNLYQALQVTREQNPNLRAIVMASDGDWNDGLPPVQAAMQLRLEKIPVFAVPFGSQSRLPDLDLLSFDVPTFGVVGKNVRLPFTIESSLPRDHVAPD